MRFPRSFTLPVTTALALLVAISARGQAVAQFVGPETHISNGAVDGPTMYWSTAGDFDGDGHIDLAAPDGVSVNNILGFSVSVGAMIRVLRAADFNNDGRSDLLVVTLTGAAVLPGNADRTFGARVPIRLPLVPNDATLADFNGDGTMDIVFPGDLGYAVVLATGDGAFTAARLLPEATPSYWAVAGDFDHDGRQDFTGAGGIFGHTYFGNGNGLFQAPIDANVTATSGTIAGDFNGDGNLDLATISATPRQDGSNWGFNIAMGMGDGTFLNAFGIVFGNQPIRGLVTADFNNDGVADIATYLTATGTVRVLAGDRQRWIAGDL